MITEYVTVDEFVADNPQRGSDREADYGLWQDGDDSRLWRLSYLRATGEIYACRLGDVPPGPVRVFGVVRPDVVLPGLASNQRWYRTADAMLDGWNVSGFDLAWVGRRLAERGAAAPPNRRGTT